MNIKEELIKGKSIYDLELRVVYYARVSTEFNTQSTSIVNQVSYFSKLISNVTGWRLVRGYIDEGISGKNIKNRVNFRKMIKDGVNNEYDLILTKSVSRFARNTIDSIKYTNLLVDYGVGVYFINDNINTFSGDSEFRLTLMASIAQDEIRKLSESVKFGLRQSIDRGVVLGSSNILGYKKNKGKLSIVERNDCIVRDIFNLFSKDIYSYSELARIINSKYYKNFDSTGIKRVLTNYKYKGYYCGRKSTVINYKNSKRRKYNSSEWIVYKDTKVVPAIVGESLWNKVNDIIAKRSKNRCNKRKIFSVICMLHNRECKYITKGYKNKIYSYYVCGKCFSIKEETLIKMTNGYKYSNIYIVKREDYLKVIIKLA